jgi:ketosteroid isomerase-like protein
MRCKASVATLLVGLLVNTGCQYSSHRLTDAHAEAIRDSVAAALSQFRQYSAAAEWDSLGAFYSDAPTFRFFESGQLQYGSAAEVRSALANLPADMRITTNYRDTEIQALAPGLALASTMFETTFSDGGGARFDFGGALTVLWVHEPGGWRILNGHSSAPVPRGG